MFYIITNIILIILNIIVLIKTFSFGIYEIKNNNNKLGGVLSIIIEIFVFILIFYIIFTSSWVAYLEAS